MPTTAEIREQLTGPGGMFEVVTDTVDGVDMKVFKSRFGSLREVAAIAATRPPDQTFLVHGARRYSFPEFVRLANSVSHTLAHRFGVRHGDRVAVLSANNPEWCLSFWGTVDLGAILVGLNGWWKTDEVRYGLDDCGAKVLVADRKRLERIVDDLDEIEHLETVFVIDADPSELGSSPKLRRFDELLVDPRDDLPTAHIDEGDPAVIFYTSGTTGKPKGAISTHRGIVANLQNTVFNTMLAGMRDAEPDPLTHIGEVADPSDWPLDDAEPAPAPPQTCSLLTSPLFHVSGCHSNLVVGLFGGVRVVIPEGKFDPVEVLKLIQREQVTIWATVPTMVWRVCEHPARHEYDTSSVTTVAFGGSPSADELQRKVLDTFPNVHSTSNAYGLTESSSVATVISGQDALAKPTSVGPPMPTVDIRIVNGSGDEVPTGGTGEVLIRGPIVMPGYWGKPEATASTVIDGWLHTGDLGHVDDEGYLYITDRAKDMIIRGGENVYCVEIENRLVEHPEIADAAVIGVPHPSLGEEVKAVIQLAEGSALTEDQVRAWVAEALADFKVPAYVELRHEKLPRNASGKLLKNLLRGSGHVALDETL